MNKGKNEVRTFYPTLEEFKDFSKYIKVLELEGVNKVGIVKVVPPSEWKARKKGYDIEEIKIKIPVPIKQFVDGRRGEYQLINIEERCTTLKEFYNCAKSDDHKTPKHSDYGDLERKYWSNIRFTPPIYAADVSGTLTDPDVTEWNLNNLRTILDCVIEDCGRKIDGVNTSYLYFGMWKATFAWHTEDMDLYSINYLHFGAPKTWYAVPPEHGKKLEQLVNTTFPAHYKQCKAHLRHKMTLLSTHFLKRNNIPFLKVVQEPGEFVITFPYAYHAGFNHGFNAAEATNFATTSWIEYGKKAMQCNCRKDGVKISMDTFVKRFQPDIYSQWLRNQNDVESKKKSRINREICNNSTNNNLRLVVRLKKLKLPYKQQFVNKKDLIDHKYRIKEEDKNKISKSYRRENKLREVDPKMPKLHPAIKLIPIVKLRKLKL